MSEWKKVKLGELYAVHNGLSKAREYFGSGFPFLSFSTVFNNYFLPERLDSSVQTSYDERKSYSIQRGDVFVTRTSETPAELGMSSVALKDYPDATYNGFCKRLRPTTNLILPEFAGYVLRTAEFRAPFYGLAASMTSRASLRNEDLLGMTIPLPSLSVQKRIGAILSDYDAAIANCRKQIALLEEAAQRLYREWFADGKGEKKKFSDIASVCSGKRPPKRSDMMTGECSVPLFGASEQMGYTSDALFSEPILITGRVGTHGIVQRVVSPCWPSDNTLVVKSQYLAFAYQFMKQIDYGSMNRGVAQPLLTQSDLKDVAMFMPSEGLLLKYEEDAGVMLKSVDVLSQQIRALTEARDRLLPKLMSGEVAV